jgi:porin
MRIDQYPRGMDRSIQIACSNASGTATPIETSITRGAIYNNPFRHNKLDQAGVGLFWSKPNLSAVGQPARKSELGFEAYYNYTIFKGLQITPDVQFCSDPALQPSAGAAAVFTIRV